MVERNVEEASLPVARLDIVPRLGDDSVCAVVQGERLAQDERAAHALEPFAVALSAHPLHLVTPRRLQIMQMKVPQSSHGYPSDARSSFPQERQVIESLSCSSLMDSGGSGMVYRTWAGR